MPHCESPLGGSVIQTNTDLKRAVVCSCSSQTHVNKAQKSALMTKTDISDLQRKISEK